MTLDLRSKKGMNWIDFKEFIGWNSEDQVWKQIGIKTVLKFILIVAAAREFRLCPCICLTSSTFQVLSWRIWLVGLKSHAYILIATGQRIASDSSAFDVRTNMCSTKTTHIEKFPSIDNKSYVVQTNKAKETSYQ